MRCAGRSGQPRAGGINAVGVENFAHVRRFGFEEMKLARPLGTFEVEH